MLVAQEAQENVVLKHISEWADVKSIAVNDMMMDGILSLFIYFYYFK